MDGRPSHACSPAVVRVCVRASIDMYMGRVYGRFRLTLAPMRRRKHLNVICKRSVRPDSGLNRKMYLRMYVRT